MSPRGSESATFNLGVLARKKTQLYVWDGWWDKQTAQRESERTAAPAHTHTHTHTRTLTVARTNTHTCRLISAQSPTPFKRPESWRGGNKYSALLLGERQRGETKGGGKKSNREAGWDCTHSHTHTFTNTYTHCHDWLYLILLNPI